LSSSESSKPSIENHMTYFHLSCRIAKMTARIQKPGNPFCGFQSVHQKIMRRAKRAVESRIVIIRELETIN
jgi:hypothetical protein